MNAFKPVFRITNRTTAALPASSGRAASSKRRASRKTGCDDEVARLRAGGPPHDAHRGDAAHASSRRSVCWPASVAGADPKRRRRELLNYRGAFELVSEYLTSGGADQRRVDPRDSQATGCGRSRRGRRCRVNSGAIQNFVVTLRKTGADRVHAPAARGSAADDGASWSTWLTRGGGHPSCSRRGYRAVSARAHPPVRRRQRPEVAVALHAMPVPCGLRLQAPVLDQRVLRPRPRGLLLGAPERSPATTWTSPGGSNISWTVSPRRWTK